MKAMRGYVLTQHEKKIITQYLEDGTRIEGFSVLKKRALAAYPQVAQDIAILSRFFATIEEEATPEAREVIRKIREWYKEYR